jgi:hypothetical protein
MSPSGLTALNTESFIMSVFSYIRRAHSCSDETLDVNLHLDDTTYKVSAANRFFIRQHYALSLIKWNFTSCIMHTLQIRKV